MRTLVTLTSMMVLFFQLEARYGMSLARAAQFFKGLGDAYKNFRKHSYYIRDIEHDNIPQWK